MTKRQVFYSFHYKPDCWRVSTIRNIGVVEGNKPAPDNDWETITKSGDDAIKKWINNQMQYRSCTVVLIGSQTAGRKWIDYEIEKSWSNKMGIVGIHIHNIKNSMGVQSSQGSNPFSSFKVNGVALDSIIKTYNPPYSDSKSVYDYIARNIDSWTNEAVQIRNRYS